MFFGLRRGSNPVGSGRRPRAKVVVGVESLEGKQLLSGAGVARPAVQAADFGLPGTLRVARFNQPGPILNEVGPGFGVKIARFYQYYTGPIRAELNATGVKGRISGDTLQLTGIVAGQIPQTPTSADEESFYYFGINRGGATFPGPFPRKPRVTFDSVVIVGVTQNGIGAIVQTDPNSFTALDPAAVTLNTDSFRVDVPLSLLPSTGAPASQYRVTFFPATEAPLTSFNSIASFVPEGRTFRVSSPRH